MDFTYQPVERYRAIMAPLFSFFYCVFYCPSNNFISLDTFIVYKCLFIWMSRKCCSFVIILKVAFQILGLKFYKITKKFSLYSQSLLIFFHKTPVDESHLTTREIRCLLRQRSTPTGNTVYFYMSNLLIYTLEIHRRKFQT